jgi:lysozyme
MESLMNWYKKAILEYQLQQLEKEAGAKETFLQGFMASLLSLLSAGLAPYEAQLIRNFMGKNNINERKLVQQVNKSSIEELTPLDIPSINPVKALEVKPIEPIQNNTQESNQNPSIQELFDFIKSHEGYKNKVYKDPAGNLAIGIGFNLDRPFSKKLIKSVGANYEKIRNGTQLLTEEQVRKLFEYDANLATQTAKNFVSNFDSLPYNAKLVLTDMAYNMGENRLNNFTKLKQALETNNFQVAANEMTNSKWYQQVGNRAKKLIELMENIA